MVDQLPDGVEVVSISADPNGAEIVDTGRYCPAPLPCLGLTAVGIVVPVLKNGTEKVGEIPATYCPCCRSWKVDGTSEWAQHLTGGSTGQ